MEGIILHGDEVRGHLDFDGNEVIGIVDASNSSINHKGKKVANKDSIVNFPIHKHSSIGDYRSHSLSIGNIGTGKLKLNGYSLIRGNDSMNIEGQSGIFSTSNISLNSN